MSKVWKYDIRKRDWLTRTGSTGDSAGNITWGFTREGAILFPEVEINYDVSCEPFQAFLQH